MPVALFLSASTRWPLAGPLRHWQIAIAAAPAGWSGEAALGFRLVIQQWQCQARIAQTGQKQKGLPGNHDQQQSSVIQQLY
jgi:hypothetical protein